MNSIDQGQAALASNKKVSICCLVSFCFASVVIMKVFIAMLRLSSTLLCLWNLPTAGLLNLSFIFVKLRIFVIT